MHALIIMIVSSRIIMLACGLKTMKTTYDDEI